MGHIETAETTGALSLLMITLGDAALCMVDMAWASRCALGSLSPGKISKRSQKCQASRKKKKKQHERKGAGPKTRWDGLFSPWGWRSLYSEVFRDYGWTEWSLDHSWRKKKGYSCIIHTLTYPIPSLSLAGWPVHSFIQRISSKFLLHACDYSRQGPCPHKPYILAGDTEDKQ